MPATVHVALLRAVNLAGLNRVAMGDLRELCEGLGLSGATTLLQSGNVVFRSPRVAASLERLLEVETRKRLKVDTSYFLRTAAEWHTMMARNPFPDEARRDPGRLIVMFLRDAPSPRDVGALQAAIKGREVVKADGRHAYITYPDGQGRSRLTNAIIEKALGTTGTARNWNTVVKLAALAAK